MPIIFMVQRRNTVRLERAEMISGALNRFRDSGFANSQLVRDFRHFQTVTITQKGNLSLAFGHAVECGFQRRVFLPAICPLLFQRVRFLYKIGRVATEGQFVDGIHVVAERDRVVLTAVAVVFRTVRPRENQRNKPREFRRFRFRKDEVSRNVINFS